MTDSPQKMIVIYDSETKLPKFTVDPPYDPSMIAFYENLVSEDATISLALVEHAPIYDKYVDIVEGINILLDRPEMDIVGEEGSIIEGITTIPTYTLSNLPPNCTILVDGNNEYTNGEETTVELALSGTGLFTILVQKFPYKDKVFEVNI